MSSLSSSNIARSHTANALHQPAIFGVSKVISARLPSLSAIKDSCANAFQLSPLGPVVPVYLSDHSNLLRESNPTTITLEGCPLKNNTIITNSLSQRRARIGQSKYRREWQNSRRCAFDFLKKSPLKLKRRLRILNRQPLRFQRA